MISTLYQRLMLKLTEYIAFIDHSDAVTNEENVAQLLSKLRDGFKLVNPILVFQIDFLERIKPGNIHLDIRVGDTASIVRVDAHLDLGHRKVG